MHADNGRVEYMNDIFEEVLAGVERLMVSQLDKCQAEGYHVKVRLPLLSHAPIMAKRT